jgi:phage terminase small subunit
MEELQKIPRKSPKPTKISPKRRLFIAEYLIDLNATQAAIRAGYSVNSAEMQGSRLMTHDNISQEIEAAFEKRLEKIGVSKDRVLTEIARLAFSDNRRLYRKDGSLLMPSEWDDETAAAIAGVETFEEFSGRGEDRTQIGITKKVKVWDKARCLELLGRHLKLFGEKTGDNGSGVTIPILLINVRNGNGVKEIDVSGE